VICWAVTAVLQLVRNFCRVQQQETCVAIMVSMRLAKKRICSIANAA